MKATVSMVCAIATCMLCSCTLMKGRSSSLAIDFQEMSVAGIKPGDPQETVVERVGYPYEVRYGRAESPEEIWAYYDLGMKVLIDKETREVDDVIVYFNRYEGYDPFRGRIVQGFPLASRFPQVEPALEGYTEIRTKEEGYVSVQVYSDDVETEYVDTEMVRLEKGNGEKMVIYFDYDKWIERVTLGRGDSREIARPDRSSREEIVVEETGEAGEEEPVVIKGVPGL